MSNADAPVLSCAVMRLVSLSWGSGSVCLADMVLEDGPGSDCVEGAIVEFAG